MSSAIMSKVWNLFGMDQAEEDEENEDVYDYDYEEEQPEEEKKSFIKKNNNDLQHVCSFCKRNIIRLFQCHKTNL